MESLHPEVILVSLLCAGGDTVYMVTYNTLTGEYFRSLNLEEIRTHLNKCLLTTTLVVIDRQYRNVNNILNGCAIKELSMIHYTTANAFSKRCLSLNYDMKPRIRIREESTVCIFYLEEMKKLFSVYSDKISEVTNKGYILSIDTSPTQQF